MAKCYYHEERDSIWTCSLCGKDVCGECAVFQDDEPDAVMCPDCNPDSLLGQTVEDHRVDEDYRETVKRRSISLRKIRIEQVLNPWLLLLLTAFLAVNAYVNHYLAQSQPRITISDGRIQKSGNPILEMSAYLAAIFNYSNDNNGKFPRDLAELYPDYIEKQLPTVLATKDKYSYAADKTHGFVLSCPVAARFGFAKMYVTREGIIYIE